MNAPLFFSARPRIDLDGQAADKMVRDLVRLEVHASSAGLTRLRAWLTAIGPSSGAADESLQWLDGGLLHLGSELQVLLPDTPVFEGRVSYLGASFSQGTPPLAQLQAEDRLWDLRQTRRIRTWQEMDLAALVRAIADEHGLQAEVQALSPTWPELQQWNETDLAFLRTRCALAGAELWVQGRTLHVAPREARSAGSELALVMGNDLLALDIDADLAHQRSRVAISGFDASAKDSVHEEADEAELAGLAAGGTSGAKALNQAFGERATQRLHDTPLNSEQARSRARAEMQARARRFVRARGLTTGSATMQVGSMLKLERVGALFEGPGYVVTELTHTYDLQHGLRTAFVAERGCILHGGG
jgi:phage protein D